MHPSIEAVLKYFVYDHLKNEKLKEISKKFSELAHELAEKAPNNPETTVGLRKLLEAKDCFVRAALE